MKRITTFFILVFGTQLVLAQPVIKTMKRLPDTGETTSYTTTFGEDNDYTINAPYFTVLSSGVVLDTVTGLMWQQVDAGEMTIDKAIVYCDTLSLAGFTNWRLPSAHEAFSILNHQYANPSLLSTVFPVSLAEYWWTADRQYNDTNKIWATNAGGGIGNHPRTETISAGGTKKFHVRAVRDVVSPTTVANAFTDNGNQTITDNLTQLVWQKNPRIDSMTWEDALQYADTFQLAGYTDWRLPNIKELQSINDEKRGSPSINKTFFPTAITGKYFSSTTLPNQTTKAWYLDTQYGITTYQYKTVKLNVVLVRGDGTITTGVNSIQHKIETNIVPNPVHTTFELFPTSHLYNVQVLNAFGTLVLNLHQVNQIDLSNFANGWYYVILPDEHQAIKLLKE
jgi:Protein of unknown function (DUF1566)